MSLAPLLNASIAIQLHAFAALGAFTLGIVQFLGPKGTLPHRSLGFVWAGLMLVVALSSFWIHELNVWGPWSPIHLISLFTLGSVPLAVWYAHTHRVRSHKIWMIAIFLGALVIAGVFTFVPGRLMYDVLLGV